MKNNLVLGAAFGYGIDKIKPFVLSLRRYYDGLVVFVVNGVDEQLNDFFNTHNIYTYEPEMPLDRGYGNVDRFRHYIDCLENFEDVDNILLTDIRDVIFQGNPFATYPNHAIEFFAEPELLGKCNHNGSWYTGLYGADELAKVSEEYVLCAGTTMGTRIEIIRYIELLIEEISNLEQAGKAHGTCDQAAHNRLVYTGKFTDYRINQNGKGLVSTMHHSKTLTFNREGLLLNDDGTPTPIVHQYDRCGPMSTVFLKNALGLKGKQGILEPAQYAVNNFYEHDLG